MDMHAIHSTGALNTRLIWLMNVSIHINENKNLLFEIVEMFSNLKTLEVNIRQ